MNRELLAALATVAAVVAGVIAFVDFSEPAQRSFYPVRVAAGGATQIEIGAPAPDFSVPTLDGDVFELAATTGNPVWINVWASWCPPCRSEMPDVDDVQRTESARGLVFLSMNFDEPLPEIGRYLQNTGYEFDVGIDPTGEFMRAYDVQGLPMHVFIDADGRVDSIRVGGMTRSEMQEVAHRLTSPSAASRAPGAAGGAQ